MDTTATLFLPSQESTVASDVDALFYFILYTAIVLFIIVVGTSAYFAVRYRRKGDTEKTSGVDHNIKLEILWTVIPTILVLIVFVWGFKTFLRLNIVPKDAVEIKVTGQKWFWSFDYPEGANSVNELTVPVGKPVKLLMSSKDVIHSFYVPNFRIKMDVLPNRYSITWFEANRIGEFNLFCTEFCGKGHSEMIGRVKVVTQEEFDKFLEAGASLGEGLTLEEYGEQLYVAKACITCHSIDGMPNTGPTWKNVYGTNRQMKDGSSSDIDENYIRESILNPMTKVAFGFQPAMPTYQGILKDRQIDALVAYIKSLQEDESLRK
jgi:cytochrome c oxidase subunit 2